MGVDDNSYMPDHVYLLGAIRGVGLPTAVSMYVVSWR